MNLEIKKKEKKTKIDFAKNYIFNKNIECIFECTNCCNNEFKNCCNNNLKNGCTNYSSNESINEYGFSNSSNHISNQKIELKLKWIKILQKFEFNLSKLKNEILKKDLLSEGIPLTLKYKVWSILIDDRIENNALKDHIIENIIPNSYQILKSIPSKFEYQIHVDVQRTCRFHFLFKTAYGKGQCELFNILVAISNSDKSIGYCQGMSDIAAIILMYFEEEEAFNFLIRIIQKEKALFDENLSFLPKITQMQNVIFSICIPEIFNHFEKNLIEFSMIGIGWYMTFFARFDIKLTLKIWDFLVFYGFNSLFYFTAAILKCNEVEILETDSDFLLEFLGKLDRKEYDSSLVVSLALAFMKKTKNKYI